MNPDQAFKLMCVGLAVLVVGLLHSETDRVNNS